MADAPEEQREPPPTGLVFTFDFSKKPPFRAVYRAMTDAELAQRTIDQQAWAADAVDDDAGEPA